MDLVFLLNILMFGWIFVAWVATAFYTATVASDKGKRFGWWFIGGILFSLVALIAAAGLPDRADD